MNEFATLGVGSLLTSTMNVFVRRFLPICAMTFVPLLAGYFALDAIQEQFGADASTNVVLMTLVEFSVLSASGAITAGFLSLLAFDAHLGRPARYGRYLSEAVRMLPHMVFVSLLVSILYVLGSMLFVIPGLFLMCALYVALPVVAIEKVGIGAMQRSFSLTAGHRWGIFGLVIVLIIASIAFGLAIATLGSVIIDSSALLNNLFIAAALETPLYGAGGVASALTYARLREMKDGIGTEEIAEIFA